MNIDTGEIGEFQGQETAELAGYMAELTGLPRSSCKRCYGRGYLGQNDEGKYVPCPCVKPADYVPQVVRKSAEMGRQAKGGA